MCQFPLVQLKKILSGAIVLDGVLRIKTTEEYKNSTVSKIMNLIENAQDKSQKPRHLFQKSLAGILLELLFWQF